jgi:hypothetical protein
MHSVSPHPKKLKKKPPDWETQSRGEAEVRRKIWKGREYVKE